jgi:hypothetical protein
VKHTVMLVKGMLLAAALWWAKFSSDAFLFLARSFPTPPDDTISWAKLAAQAQGYLVVYGPALAAILICFVSWPAKSKKNS